VKRRCDQRVRNPGDSPDTEIRILMDEDRRAYTANRVTNASRRRKRVAPSPVNLNASSATSVRARTPAGPRSSAR
jgi:hypothetical protein